MKVGRFDEVHSLPAQLLPRLPSEFRLLMSQVQSNGRCRFLSVSHRPRKLAQEEDADDEENSHTGAPKGAATLIGFAV